MWTVVDDWRGHRLFKHRRKLKRSSSTTFGCFVYTHLLLLAGDHQRTGVGGDGDVDNFDAFLFCSFCIIIKIKFEGGFYAAELAPTCFKPRAACFVMDLTKCLRSCTITVQMEVDFYC